MFHVSWSKHCSRLAPVWEELADKYNNLQESAVRAAVPLHQPVTSHALLVIVIFTVTLCLYSKQTNNSTKCL